MSFKVERLIRSLSVLNRFRAHVLDVQMTNTSTPFSFGFKKHCVQPALITLAVVYYVEI